MTDILLTYRVCRGCGAEAWVGCPVAEHPHFANCPGLYTTRDPSEAKELCETCDGAGRINVAIPIKSSDPTFEPSKRWAVCPPCGGSGRKPTEGTQDA